MEPSRPAGGGSRSGKGQGWPRSRRTVQGRGRSGVKVRGRFPSPSPNRRECSLAFNRGIDRLQEKNDGFVLYSALASLCGNKADFLGRGRAAGQRALEFSMASSVLRCTGVRGCRRVLVVRSRGLSRKYGRRRQQEGKGQRQAGRLKRPTPRSWAFPSLLPFASALSAVTSGTDSQPPSNFSPHSPRTSHRTQARAYDQ
jgi:hypothetical protein